MKSVFSREATPTVSAIRAALWLVVISGHTLSLTGCVVAGVSGGGKFFIWPGSIGLLVLILVFLFVVRRRR